MADGEVLVVLWWTHRRWYSLARRAWEVLFSEVEATDDGRADMRTAEETVCEGRVVDVFGEGVASFEVRFEGLRGDRPSRLLSLCLRRGVRG